MKFTVKLLRLRMRCTKKVIKEMCLCLPGSRTLARKLNADKSRQRNVVTYIGLWVKYVCESAFLLDLISRFLQFSINETSQELYYSAEKRLIN